MCGTLTGVAGDELTISLTTHYLDEADAHCDRVAIVDGRKIAVTMTAGAFNMVMDRFLGIHEAYLSRR